MRQKCFSLCCTVYGIFQIIFNIIVQAEVQTLRSTVSHLRDQNLVLRAAQANIGDGKENATSNNDMGQLEKELQTYKTMVVDLENRLTEYSHVVQENKDKDNEKKESEDYNRMKELEYQLKLKTEEIDKFKKDQEALLELLTDQDNKITRHKERLVELGDKVCFMFLFLFHAQ